MFEQIELQAKLLNYFLGSNKSNINQSVRFFNGTPWHIHVKCTQNNNTDEIHIIIVMGIFYNQKQMSK